jgi:hypothetical protein
MLGAQIAGDSIHLTKRTAGNRTPKSYAGKRNATAERPIADSRYAGGDGYAGKILEIA